MEKELKELIEKITKMTLEAIVLAMQEAGMDEKQKNIFLEKYTEYFQAMTETMLKKGGNA